MKVDWLPCSIKLNFLWSWDDAHTWGWKLALRGVSSTEKASDLLLVCLSPGPCLLWSKTGSWWWFGKILKDLWNERQRSKNVSIYPTTCDDQAWHLWPIKSLIVPPLTQCGQQRWAHCSRCTMRVPLLVTPWLFFFFTKVFSILGFKFTNLSFHI